MLRNRARTVAFLAVSLLPIGAAVQAADIAMNADDGLGTSSFNSGLHWSDGSAPSPGNNYFNANFLLRTPADANSYTFGGDSLTITSDSAIGSQLNDALMFKGTGTTGIITVNHLTIDGGNLRHANGEGQTFTVAGNGLTVGANGMGVHLQGPTFITAPVLGSGTIKIVDNGSNDARRTLHFVSALNTFHGHLELPTANRSRFALDEGANLNFTIGASGVNNRVSGAGVATFNGTFKFDLSAAGTNLGDTWQLVDVSTLAETFGATFSVDGFFHNASTNTWAASANGAIYTFDPATGALKVTATGSNLAPIVDAGPDQVVSLTTGSATLSGSVADDGQPVPPGATVSLWTVDSQPAGSTILFADPTQPTTTVTVDTAGDYVLRLSACDDGNPGACSGLESADTMTLTVEPSFIWDGGDATGDDWSLAANWVNDLSPIFTGGISTLTFTGLTRLTPNNDVAGADVKTIQFDAGAGSFQLNGQALTIQASVNNNSTGLQTLNTAQLALGTRQVAFAATADITVTGPVTGAGGLVKNGAGVLSIANANAYGGLTTVNDGTLNIASSTGLGLAPVATTGMTFVDAIGDVGGNTVRDSDGDPSAWLTTMTNPGDNLWYSWNNTTSDGTTTFLESGPGAEDTPLLRTTLTGLTPGQAYTVGVVYWSGPAEDWSIRAGWAPDQLTVFNRSGNGAVAGSFTGTAIVFTWGSAVQLVGSLGTATADGSGQIVVYVDDLPTAGDATRCWYDGLACWPGAVPAGEGTFVAGGTSQAVIQLSGNITSSEQITLSGRQTTPAPTAHIRNVSGHNALLGTTILVAGGSEYPLESAAGHLSIQDIVCNSHLVALRNVRLTGAGNGSVDGVIRNGSHTGDLAVVMEGTGTWTLSNESPELDAITVTAGTLALHSALANNVPDATITVGAGAVLDVTGLGGGLLLSSANQQTLGGSGLVNGKVTVANATTVRPGLGAAAGTLTINGGLTFNDGSTLKVRIGASSDLLRVSGGALTGANTAGVAVDIDAAGAVPGTYTLLDWTGATAVGVDLADFVTTGIWGSCLAGALRIDGSTLVIDYTAPAIAGAVDDFQSYTPGRVDALVGAPWRVIPSTGSQFVTIGEDVDSRFLAFQMYNVSGNNGRGTYRPLGCNRIPDGQTRTLFFRWLAADSTSLNHYIGLTDSTYAPTGTAATDVDDLRVRLRLVPGTDGTTVAFRYPDGTNDVTGRDGLLTNTWYNVWLVVRNNAGATADVCDYYLNAGLQSADPVADLVAANIPFRAQVAADLVNFAAVAWLNTAQNLVYIDDIHVLDGASLVNPLFQYGGFDFVEPFGYVDSMDLGVFTSCMTGPTVSGPPTGCSAQDFSRADSDRDGDVDLDDFGRFQQCYSGSVAGNPDCATW